MTEQEWLECADPRQMLEFLGGRASDRKLRIFACACALRVWHRIEEGEVSQEIEAGERFAEGRSSREELSEIRAQLGARGGFSAAWAANNALHAVLDESAEDAAKRAVTHAADFMYYDTVEHKPLTDSGGDVEAVCAYETERTELTFIVRELFGNPFCPISINPDWRTLTVTTLAAVAYDERALPSGELDPARLAVLSDALEEAGCDNADILEHLRSPDPHVRGCWALDLVLEKR